MGWSRSLDENFQCVITGTVGEVRALSPSLSLVHYAASGVVTTGPGPLPCRTVGEGRKPNRRVRALVVYHSPHTEAEVHIWRFYTLKTLLVAFSYRYAPWLASAPSDEVSNVRGH